VQQCNTAIEPRCGLTLWKDTLSEPGALERISALPTGTVTFLFTDIEGSTQRWESHRAAMDGAVKRHDALLRETAERHNGMFLRPWAMLSAWCLLASQTL